MGRRLTTIAIGAAAVAVAAVTGAAAVIPGGDGTVDACVANDARTSSTGVLGPQVTLDRKGTLRAVDGEAGEQCRGDERPLTFNVQGKQGPPGVGAADGRWVSERVVIPSNQTRSVTAACAEDEEAVSGGYLVNWDRGVVVVASNPLFADAQTDAVGWHVTAGNDNTFEVGVSAYALCLPKSR